jgi:hypothetical protein
VCVRALQDRVEQVEKSVQDNVASLQDKIALVDATHNSTRDTLLTSMQKLEAKLVEQANTEANADTSTTASIDEFKTELNDLNSFKSDSEKSAAELVKKLTVSEFVPFPLVFFFSFIQQRAVCSCIVRLVCLSIPFDHGQSIRTRPSRWV